jgi:hypothetical protein
MYDVRIFKHISVKGDELWMCREAELPHIPWPNATLLLGPSMSGEYIEDSISCHGVYFRTGDPIVAITLDEDILLAADLEDDEDPEEAFKDLVNDYKDVGFRECRSPKFDSSEYDMDFPLAL